jgi:TonB family protein
MANQGLVVPAPSPKYARLAPRRDLRWLASAVIFTATAATTFVVVFAFGYMRTHSSPMTFVAVEQPRASAPDGGLGLRVEEKSDRLLISWDRNAESVKTSSSAVLHIVDGLQHRNVEMDPVQIAHGSVIYKPHSDDVSIRLEISTRDGRKPTETVRVLGLPAAPAPALAANSVAPKETPSLAIPAVVEKNSEGPKTPEDDSFAKSSKVPTTFSSTDGRSSPTLVPAALVVPAGSNPAKSSVLQTSDETMQAPATTELPPVPKPAVNVTPPAAAPSPIAAPFTAYAPPRPVYRSIPRLVPSMGVYAPTDVSVDVRIDEKGHVISARLTDPKSKASAVLTQACLAAARQWTFEPAQLRNKAVASDHSIVFRFNPRLR